MESKKSELYAALAAEPSPSHHIVAHAARSEQHQMAPQLLQYHSAGDRLQTVVPPHASPVAMMSGSPVTAAAPEAMTPAGSTWMTPPTSEPRRQPADLYPEMSGVSDESWNSFPLQPEPAHPTSRTVPAGHDLIPLDVANNGDWPQKSVEENLDFQGLETEGPIGQAYTTDDAVTILDLRYPDSAQGSQPLNLDGSLNRRRMSGSPLTAMSDLPSYDEYSAAMSEAPSYGSDYPATSNRNSIMSSIQLSPVASPRMTSHGRPEQHRGAQEPTVVDGVVRPGPGPPPVPIRVRQQRLPGRLRRPSANVVPRPRGRQLPCPAAAPRRRRLSRRCSRAVRHGRPGHVPEEQHAPARPAAASALPPGRGSLRPPCSAAAPGPVQDASEQRGCPGAARPLRGPGGPAQSLRRSPRGADPAARGHEAFGPRAGSLRAGVEVRGRPVHAAVGSRSRQQARGLVRNLQAGAMARAQELGLLVRQVVYARRQRGHRFPLSGAPRDEADGRQPRRVGGLVWKLPRLGRPGEQQEEGHGVVQARIQVSQPSQGQGWTQASPRGGQRPRGSGQSQAAFRDAGDGKHVGPGTDPCAGRAQVGADAAHAPPAAPEPQPSGPDLCHSAAPHFRLEAAATVSRRRRRQLGKHCLTLPR